MNRYVKECQSCRTIIDEIILRNCKCGGKLEIDGTDYPYYDFWTRCKKCNKTGKIYNDLELLLKAEKRRLKLKGVK